MPRNRFVFLLILLLSFSAISHDAVAGTRIALAQTPKFRSENCVPQPKKSGFSLGGQSRGSVVTLCAKFVAEKTLVKPKAKVTPKPVIPVKSDGNASSKQARARLERIRRVSLSGNSFSPKAIAIHASPIRVRPNQELKLKISRSRQYRTAYLLGRFVGLRFTPLRVVFEVNRISRPRLTTTGPFTANLTLKSSGTWPVRGLVFYRAEYRANRDATWHQVPGNLQLAAKPAKVMVSKLAATNGGDAPDRRRAYLVLEDCLKSAGGIGCLN